MNSKETVTQNSTLETDKAKASVGVIRKNTSIRKRSGVPSSFRPLKSLSKVKSVKPLQYSGKREA